MKTIRLSYRTFNYSVLNLLFLIVIGFFGCSSSDNPVDTPIDDPNDGIENPTGFDPDRLNAALANANALDNFYALMVIRNETTVVENYYDGKSAGTPFHLRSITKNITSALTGIAIEENLIPSLDQGIKLYYPELISGDKEAITIRHLLNMSSGLTWDEDAEVVDLLEYVITDPITEVLSRPLDQTPGLRFNYNTVSPHIVSDIVSHVTGTSFRDYAQAKLFGPLAINDLIWDTDADGNVWGGTGIQMTARDLRKFGQLYLDNGNWNGLQIVPADWVAQSQDPQIETFDPTSGYSLQWWTSSALDADVYYGQGYGGQALMLVPEKDLIVIAFQESFVLPNQANAQWTNFLNQVFIPIYQALED